MCRAGLGCGGRNSQPFVSSASTSNGLARFSCAVKEFVAEFGKRAGMHITVGVANDFERLEENREIVIFRNYSGGLGQCASTFRKLHGQHKTLFCWSKRHPRNHRSWSRRGRGFRRKHKTWSWNKQYARTAPSVPWQTPTYFLTPPTV
jgi:hypothetical protein